MANEQHLALLRQGVEAWNAWREQNDEILPDLTQSDLAGANLNRADLSSVDLTGASLHTAMLSTANLNGANLSQADLKGANLRGAVLKGTSLHKANLDGADLSEATLDRVDLTHASARRASLQRARLYFVDLSAADISGCKVFGVSAWGLKLQGTIQSDLATSLEDEAPISVDNIELAQFIYGIMTSEDIRAAINSISSKFVLIIGRFTGERVAIKHALENELRKRGYVPLSYEFATSMTDPGG